VTAIATIVALAIAPIALALLLVVRIAVDPPRAAPPRAWLVSWRRPRSR
jgi:hypothetical protein